MTPAVHFIEAGQGPAVGTDACCHLSHLLKPSLSVFLFLHTLYSSSYECYLVAYTDKNLFINYFITPSNLGLYSVLNRLKIRKGEFDFMSVHVP